jgi:hypothetical protein
MSNSTRLKQLECLQKRLDEIQFCKAMERYLRLKGEMVIAWYEVLMVVKALGYRKVSVMCREERPHSE